MTISDDERPEDGQPEDEHPFKAGIVSLVGRTNVGKSTLMNRIVGEKISIMSPKVQTTRQAIRGIHTTDTAQIVFLDTPGFLTQQRTRLDEKMDLHARSGLDVDLVMLMVTPHDIESEETAMIITEIKKRRQPAFLLINKIDLVRKETLLPMIERFAALGLFTEIIPISALKGINIPELEAKIVEMLPEAPPLYDPEIISTANLRSIVAETIREKVYANTHQEIPYAAAVKIEEYIEDVDLVRIAALIYVERESQKGIVVGKGGSMIKRIGIAARQEIEPLVESKVFLSLKVRVKRNWRSDDQFLRSLGL